MKNKTYIADTPLGLRSGEQVVISDDKLSEYACCLIYIPTIPYPFDKEASLYSVIAAIWDSKKKQWQYVSLSETLKEVIGDAILDRCQPFHPEVWYAFRFVQEFVQEKTKLADNALGKL